MKCIGIVHILKLYRSKSANTKSFWIYIENHNVSHGSANYNRWMNINPRTVHHFNAIPVIWFGWGGRFSDGQLHSMHVMEFIVWFSKICIHCANRNRQSSLISMPNHQHYNTVVDVFFITVVVLRCYNNYYRD